MRRRRSRWGADWYAAHRDDLEERFARQIEVRSNGCWEWIGPIENTDSYPVCYTGLRAPRRVGARILSWYLTHDEAAGGALSPWPAVCRNEHCVAPEHLALCSRGEVRYYQGNTVLTPGQALEIYERAERGEETLTDIAEEYGIDQELVSLIAHGKRWADITGGKPVRKLPRRFDIETKARAVAAAITSEGTVKDAAATSGVPYHTLCSWLHRYRRLHVGEWADQVDRYLRLAG